MRLRLSSGFLRAWRNGSAERGLPAAGEEADPAGIVGGTADGRGRATPAGGGGPAEADGGREGRAEADSGRDGGVEPVPGATDAEGPSPSAAPAGVSPVTVPRWVQLVALPLALLALWALARAAGSLVLIVIAASTLALILNPLVKTIQRARVPRGLAILLVYVGGFAALGGIGVLLADPVSTQVNHFANDVPSFVRHANRDLANFQRFLNRHGIKVQIEQQGQTALQTLEKNLLKGSGNVVSFSRDLLGKIVTVSFDLVLVLILSIYMLIYGREIGRLVRRVMPAGEPTPDDDFPLLVQRAVFGYVRGQLLFSLIMGVSTGVCLWIIGVLGIFPDGAHYAVFFGGFYGLMELIPYIGPILGAIPPVLVALLNDPIVAIWLVLMFLALQQLEGHVVAPQVFKLSLRINPILIILALLIGYQLYGVGGALVALPMAAVIRETIIYLRRHLVLEPWSRADPGARVAEHSASPAPGPAGGPGVEPAPAGGQGAESAPADGQGVEPAPAGGQGAEPAPADGQGVEPAPADRQEPESPRVVDTAPARRLPRPAGPRR